MDALTSLAAFLATPFPIQWPIAGQPTVDVAALTDESALPDWTAHITPDIKTYAAPTGSTAVQPLFETFLLADLDVVKQRLPFVSMANVTGITLEIFVKNTDATVGFFLAPEGWSDSEAIKKRSFASLCGVPGVVLHQFRSGITVPQYPKIPISMSPHAMISTSLKAPAAGYYRPMLVVFCDKAVKFEMLVRMQVQIAGRGLLGYM